MGGGSSKCRAPVIARCSAPAYCVKQIGSRHLLLGGGGGASKTGVENHIQVLLLTFSRKTATVIKSEVEDGLTLAAKITSSLKTDPHATMNMDCVLIGSPEQGRYLLAAGHDQYCDLYESQGFSLAKTEDEQLQLTISFEKVSRLITDENANTPYQKTVRFDRSIEGQPQKLYTGGADGYIRIWDVDSLRKRDSAIKQAPLVKIEAHSGDIDDLDISPNGKLCISVGHDAAVHIWDTANGERISTISVPEEIGEGFRTRSIRFTALGSKNAIFLSTYNQIRRTSKTVSYVALWAFSRERDVCRPILVREACKETISTLAVSNCGNFFALGTLNGSVGIYDTHELKSLYFAQETHGIFVTGIEFLSKRTNDFRSFASSNERQRCFYPGVASEYRAAVVSLSADQTVQFHAVPYSQSTSFTSFLLKLSFVSFFLYYIVWYLCDWPKKMHHFA